MTSQPPPYPAGPPDGWDQPPAGTDWSPSGAGYGPPQHEGYPGMEYPQAGHARSGCVQPGGNQPGYSQPGQAPPGYSPSGYPTAGYPQPGYPQPGPVQPGYVPSGYAQPGYVPSAHAQPGYAQPGQPPFAQPGTNGLAITSLVLGLFGMVGGCLPGIVFGILALRKIRRTGQNGRGLAIAGLILSGISIVLLAVGIVAVVSSSAHRDPSTGAVAAGRDVAATSLQVGDCVNNLRDSTNLLSLPAVPCAQPHEGEVFAVFDLPAGPFPGADTVKKTVTSECSSRFAHYAPHSTVADPGLFSVYPRQANWDDNDRQVVCIATPGSGGTSTGSIKGS